MSLAGSLFLASIPILISLYAEKYRVADFNLAFPDDPLDFGLPMPESFDFVVVGGGTAGSIVANRLSEKYSVLLLEAGGTPPPLQSVPLTFHSTMEHPDINFMYKSIPQKNAGLNFGGRILTTAGKMLGGCSSHNGMMYERGHPRDFDRWADLTEDDSWKYENVLQYFKLTEKYTGKLKLNEGQHGFDGPVHMREDTWAPGGDIWLDAGRELGYNIVDSNGPQAVGFSRTVFTKRNGRRESTYSAYIKPIEKTRKNLVIYRYSYGSEVIFDENKTAIGVRYTRHGVPRVAFAKKEVILSAGAYVSPLILIKSGIGPVDQLEAAKVKPISILPVGHSLMDHPLLLLGPIYVDKPEYAFHSQTNLTFEDFTNFVDNGDGPLSGEFQGSRRAVIASSRNSAELGLDDWPNLMIFYTYLNDNEPNSVYGFIGVQNIRTRGTIKLNTTATCMGDDNLPLIDFTYFNDESDLDVAVEGINFFLKVMEETEAFKKIGARYGGKPIDSCQHLTFRSDDYWKCWVRHTTGTTWHPTGTCQMGNGPKDDNAVVDSKLRVLGVKNLRVVDSSIMPIVTNANTFAPTMMIAEKASADILKDHQATDDKKRTKSEL